MPENISSIQHSFRPYLHDIFKKTPIIYPSELSKLVSLIFVLAFMPYFVSCIILPSKKTKNKIILDR